MAEAAGRTRDSSNCVVLIAIVHPSSLSGLASPSERPPISSFWCTLAKLADRLPKLPAKLLVKPPLSLRIINDADARTRCSLLDRAVIPGNGNTSRVQTSDKRASTRALSAREGARTGIRLFVVKSDCDLFIREAGPEAGDSFSALVFFRMT
jgi:hypothetical protein